MYHSTIIFIGLVAIATSAKIATSEHDKCASEDICDGYQSMKLFSDKCENCLRDSCAEDECGHRKKECTVCKDLWPACRKEAPTACSFEAVWLLPACAKFSECWCKAFPDKKECQPKELKNLEGCAAKEICNGYYSMESFSNKCEACIQKYWCAYVKDPYDEKLCTACTNLFPACQAVAPTAGNFVAAWKLPACAAYLKCWCYEFPERLECWPREGDPCARKEVCNGYESMELFSGRCDRCIKEACALATEPSAVQECSTCRNLWPACFEAAKSAHDWDAAWATPECAKFGECWCKAYPDKPGCQHKHENCEEK